MRWQRSGGRSMGERLRVLVACEESQEVRKAFRALGHESYSCDILPTRGGHPEWHFAEREQMLWENLRIYVVAWGGKTARRILCCI